MPYTPARLAYRRPWPGTRRGLCLWFFSVGFVLIGSVNYIGTDLLPPTAKTLAFALSIADAEVWGWVMVVIGLAAMWSSYCHFGRDRFGFTLLATFCAAWGLGFLSGGLFYGAGTRALGYSIIWFLFSAILTLIAGFPNVVLGGNPPPIVVSPESPDDDLDNDSSEPLR